MKPGRLIVVIVGLASISTAQQIDLKSKPWNGERQVIPGKITAAFYEEVPAGKYRWMDF